jgi:hypothetical protein
MYTTKELNPKNSKNFISTGDPYISSTKGRTRSSYKGKQLQTSPAKKGQINAAYFASYGYSASGYNKPLDYRTTQPIDSRKLGFGSRDADRRDEFSSNLRVQQYREKLKKEHEHVKDQLTSGTYRPRSEETHEEAYKKKYRDHPELFQTQVPFCLYPFFKTQSTAFNKKSSRDRFYPTLYVSNAGLRRKDKRPTSNQAYGNFTHNVQRPQYGSKNHMKSFEDSSHLHVGH